MKSYQPFSYILETIQPLQAEIDKIQEDVLKELKMKILCDVEDCMELSAREIRDLDYKGNVSRFCENHANSFEAREKYVELEETKATGN